MAVITGIGLLLLLGAMGKSAQAPLMVWLPDAMAGPTPVSAQIHAATMVTAGVYLLMRMFPLIGLSTVVVSAIAVTGAFTAFYGATCALAERDLKRILAYSTISQIGYMMLAVGSGAITAATFHLIVHAFFKALLFLGAGCIINAMHHEQDIFRMGGLRRSLPRVFWPFLAGALCLAGIPPTGGFFSKDSILSATWAKGGMFYGTLYAVGLFTVFLTVIYTFRMVFVVFGDHVANRQQKQEITPAPLQPVPRIMETMLIPLALLGLAGGLFNLPAYLANGMLDSFLGPLNEQTRHLSATTELALQGMAAMVALGGIWVAWLFYGRERRGIAIAQAEQAPTAMDAFLQAGWYVDNLYHFLFIRPYKWLSGVLWQRVDEGVLDDSLDGMAFQLGRTGQLLGRWGGGRISVYLLSLAGRCCADGRLVCLGDAMTSPALLTTLIVLPLIGASLSHTVVQTGNCCKIFRPRNSRSGVGHRLSDLVLFPAVIRSVEVEHQPATSYMRMCPGLRVSGYVLPWEWTVSACCW